MFVSKSTLNRAIGMVRSHPKWTDIVEIAGRNSEKFYLVGGQLYRNLAAAIHLDSTLEADNVADFDFYVIGKPLKSFLPETLGLYGSTYEWVWHEESNHPYNAPTAQPRRIRYPNSARAVNIKTGQKIDLISSIDICNLVGVKDPLEAYYRAVPLDIQAISYNFAHEKFGGWALRPLNNKCISINNPSAQIPNGSLRAYAILKAQSMGFRCDTSVLDKHKCHCPIDVLVAGCKCGGR